MGTLTPSRARGEWLTQRGSAMNVRTMLTVFLLAGSGALVAPPGASAAVCQETDRVRFDPPLTTTYQYGTLHVDFVKQCVGGGSGSGGGLQFDYYGTCETATAWTPGVVDIIGGTAYVQPSTSNAKDGVLVPDSANPCDFSTGSLYGVKLD